MKKIRIFLGITLLITMGMISCSKTGDTGATGPAGPKGDTGAAGPDSVVYSSWITLNFVQNTTNADYEDTIIAPSLTKRILDSGVVLTYINFLETDGTYHVYAVSALSNYVLEDYSVGKINIIAVNDFTGVDYRYVTIPGSLKLGNSTNPTIKGYTIQELKAMPYEKMQQVFADKN